MNPLRTYIFSDTSMLLAFDIPRFALLIDFPLIIIVFLATLAKTLHWVYKTDQEDVPKNSETASRIMFRMAVIAIAVGGFCYLTGIASWFLAIIAAVLVLLTFMQSLLGVFGLPIVVAGAFLQEYVLGFPGLILSPKDRDEPASAADPNPMIGQAAVTFSPLRPQGEIMIDRQRFPAASDSGKLIDSGVSVCVVGTKNGNLLVNEIENDR